MKLLARNLSRSTSEDELRTAFEAFGAVQSCVLVTDKVSGLSKGFGFVEMPKQGNAKAAMISLNGSDLGGQKIRVKKDQSKSPAGDAGAAKPDG